MSKFQEHVKRWKDCRGCPYHGTRQRVVFARGKIPAPLLFIGEAPGDSEDVLGAPFVGPAGKHPSCGLDAMIAQAIDGQYDYAITNLVGCIPWEDGAKAGAPSEASIIACAPKLAKFIELCQPRLIVCVGDLAWQHVPTILILGASLDEIEVRRIKITHPAFILRSNVAQRGLLVQKNVVEIEEAIEQL